jgi:nucleoside-diphosphate-sugar epimerase
MKFFITGANGFIGSYLCNYLLKNGHQVFASSRKFLPEIKTVLSGAEFIEADVLSPEFEKIKIDADCIIHLAASNDIVSKNLSRGIELSVAGTVNALKLAVNNNIPKFIFYSTLQVYGTELSGNYDEQTPVKPENDYAMNHLFGEMYVEQYSRKFGLKTLVARPSNIYGRFLSPQINRWTLVPGCLIKEGIENGTITLLSSGNQNRNFISLEQLSYYTEKVAINMDKQYDNVNFVSDDFKRIVDVAISTQEILKNDFGKEVELIIKSDQPQKSNPFSFNYEKLTQYGIELNHTKEISLTTEIKNISQMILKEQNVIQS